MVATFHGRLQSEIKILGKKSEFTRILLGFKCMRLKALPVSNFRDSEGVTFFSPRSQIPSNVHEKDASLGSFHRYPSRRHRHCRIIVNYHLFTRGLGQNSKAEVHRIPITSGAQRGDRGCCAISGRTLARSTNSGIPRSWHLVERWCSLEYVRVLECGSGSGLQFLCQSTILVIPVKPFNRLSDRQSPTSAELMPGKSHETAL
jgi:hypothetical protein